ncbi:MAG: ribonuclease P protein component [Planctomycetota bacterium]
MNKANFPANLRIKKRDEFQSAFRQGVVAADGVLVMHAIHAEQGSETRLGISIAKRVGNAPQRNYWKRLIREAFRTQKAELPAGLMIIVRPKKGAEPDFDSVKRSLVALARRVARKLKAEQQSKK